MRGGWRPRGRDPSRPLSRSPSHPTLSPSFPLSFTDLGKRSVDALGLEGLRELSTLRGLATGKAATPLCGGDPGGEDAWAERAAALARYLSLLSTFAARTAAAPSSVADAPARAPWKPPMGVRA